MTTNHRPTLESKRGKVQAIGDTISHSRALPQQTQLKYRKDLRTRIDPNKIETAVEELKVELLKDEGELSDFKPIYEDQIPYKKDEMDVARNTIQNKKPFDKDTEENNSQDEQDSREHSSEGDDPEGESNTDDDSDSDDETAQLMAELAKIKQEKEEKKKKLEIEEITKQAVSSNPLVKISNTESKKEKYKVKKNWRGNTAFKLKNKIKENDDSEYTNDTLNSDYHQKFLSKYVR